MIILITYHKIRYLCKTHFFPHLLAAILLPVSEVRFFFFLLVACFRGLYFLNADSTEPVLLFGFSEANPVFRGNVDKGANQS